MIEGEKINLAVKTGSEGLDKSEVAQLRDIILGKICLLYTSEQNSVLDTACTVYREMENAFRAVLDAMDEMKRLERQMAECPDDHMLLERHAQLSAAVSYTHLDVYKRQAEDGALRDTLAHFSLPNTEDAVSQYHDINNALWAEIGRAHV